jgi:flagellar biosynthesis protein FlhB
MPMHPRFVGSNPEQAILRAIKILNTHFFGGEIKPEAQRLKILQHVKQIYEYQRQISQTKSIISFTQILPIC